MSVQKKLIDDILSLYDTILEKNNLYETTSNLRSTLSSLGYKEKNYNLTTGGDVNDKLTDIVATILKQYKADYPTAMVTVTSGNDRYHQNLGYKSQHTMGNAIDVVISPYDSQSAAAFLKILNSTVTNTPGFKYLDEYTKPSKASTGGHYHLQYGKDTKQPTTSSSTSTGTETSTTGTETSTTGTETSTTDKDYTGGAGKFARDIGSKILDVIGIKESFEPSSFGNNVQSNRGRLMIPKKTNSKIKSPVSGVIVDINTSQSCINQTVIEFSEGYLEYCGITNPSLKTGDKVRVGNSLGTTNSNVTVTLFTRKKNKKDIELDNEEPTDSKPKNRESLLVKGYHNLKKSSKEKEPETKSNNTKNSNYLLVRGYQKLKKSFDKTPNKKLDENIERIKGLLK
jgi:hypothetical protein